MSYFDSYSQDWQAYEVEGTTNLVEFFCKCNSTDMDMISFDVLVGIVVKSNVIDWNIIPIPESVTDTGIIDSTSSRSSRNSKE